MSPPNSAPPGSDESHHLPLSATPEEASEEPLDGHPKLLEEQQPLNRDPDVVSEDAEVVVPPDGGWGWVIVFASFMCNMIVDGIIFSFGIFMKPIADEMQVSNAHVALVGSLMSGFYLIVGPFASALANRYGFRMVGILGSFLATAAFALSFFATSVQHLCFSFGVLGGIGFGLIYVPAVITVGFYFERWRALATGIGVCGSGIGTFLFAPMTSSLIKSLGWREALLCQGAIVLTCALFGILYRPLKPTKIKDIEVQGEGEPELQMDPSKLNPVTRLKMEQALGNMKTTSCAGSQSSIQRMFGVNNNASYPRISDVYHTIHVPQQRSQDMYCYEKRLSVPFILEDKPKDVEGKERLLQVNGSNALIFPRSPKEPIPAQEVNRPMYRDDIFFGASLTRLPQYTSRTSLAYNLSVTRLPTKNDIEEEKKHSCKICPEAVKRTLVTMLDLSLLKSPTFLMLAFGGFFTMMGFYVPFMFLVDRAKISGMEEASAIFLISSIGIANTIGRVLCGVLSSFPGVNALFVTNAALTIGGLATMLSGFSMGIEFQYTYTAVFGLSIACFASLRSIVVVDLLGLERLTNAFGLLLLFQGVAAVIGAPLAGAFKIATGSYDASFYLSGGLILASAIMCYPLNYINRREKERNARTEIQSVPV